MNDIYGRTVQHEQAKEKLSRVAAAELVGRSNGPRLAPSHPRHPQKYKADLVRPWETFLRAVADGVSRDEILAAACREKTTLTAAELRKEVGRWLTLMDSAERSATRLAVGPLPWGPESTGVIALYTVQRTDKLVALEVPGHVLAWAKDKGLGYKDLGKKSPHDTPAVIEVMLNLYDPYGQGRFKEPKHALRAARAIVNEA